MNLGRFVSVALAVFLAGCGHVNMFVDASVDPAVAPKKTDPIFLSLSAKPSIRERQLLVSLKAELCRNKFNVVDDAARSQWTLGLTSGRHTFESAAVATAVQNPFTSVVVGSSHREFQTNQYALLFLYRTEDLMAGKQLAVWEGQVAAESDYFNSYEPIIFKNVLDVFGKNFADESRVDKSYYRQVTECASKGAGVDCSCAK